MELYDAHAAQHGYLSKDGHSPPWVREYFAALNTARHALKALQEHLKTRAPKNRLADYLAEHYGREDEDD